MAPPQFPEECLWMLRGLGQRITRIPRQASTSHTTLRRSELIQINNVELLSSYNTVESGSLPVIIVPGGPPVLRTDVSFPLNYRKLKAHLPPSVLSLTTQPGLQAIELTRPDFRFNDVDIVVNSGVLGRLIRFCGFRLGHDRPYRINASIIHGSLILEHALENTQERMQSKLLRKPRTKSERTAYGSRFEGALVSYPKGLERWPWHMRILRYDLGPLTCVVHYEGDATIEPYGDFALATPDIIPAPDNRSATVVSRGRLTPQASSVEVKTYVGSPFYTMKLLMQMWLTRTKYLVTGDQYGGITDGATMRDPWANVEGYMAEPDVQGALQKLILMIPALKAAVRATRKRQATLIFREDWDGRVEVYDNSHREGMITQTMISKFWDTPGHET